MEREGARRGRGAAGGKEGRGIRRRRRRKH